MHLNAYSAKGSGSEMLATPSKTLGMHVSKREFVATVSRRLGVHVIEGDCPCCFCGELMDAGGIHCLSCMARGDAIAMHNGVRDVYYDYCLRAALRPRSEAPKVLQEVLGRDDRRRPADVLWIPALTLAKKLPNGERAVRSEPVCFDFAVINALGQGHWADTAVSPGSAAEKYADGKRSRHNTESLCKEAGFRFWPVVHEIQGGCGKEAEEAMRAIAASISDRESKAASVVLSEMKARLAAVITRASARAIFKRQPVPNQRSVYLRNAIVVSEQMAAATETSDLPDTALM